MKKLILSSAILFCVICTLGPSSCGEPWEVTFDYGGIDFTNDMTATVDGSAFVIAGYTTSFNEVGYNEALLMKVDVAGKELWRNTYVYNANNDTSNIAYGVTSTSDGGFLLTGSTTDDDRDILIVKTDENGNKQWMTKYAGNDQWGVDLTKTSDGNYLMVGRCHPSEDMDIYLLKIDINGNKIWQKTIAGANDQVAEEITATSDGGAVIAGYSQNTDGPTGTRKAMFTKVDTNGNVLWSNEHNIIGDEYIFSVATTSDGYIFAGYYQKVGNIYLIKTDADGNVLWNKNTGVSGAGWSVLVDSDGGYLVAANQVNGYEVDAVVVKFDSVGNYLWTQSASDKSYTAVKILPTIEGGYVVAGTANASFDCNEWYCWLVTSDLLLFKNFPPLIN